MARFSDDTINRIKQDVSLVRLVETSGVTLKAHGQDKIGHCPFHNDKTPSLVVSPESNLWHCLGACQTGGSVIDWVIKTQGVSFRHAVEILRNDIPALAAVEKPVKKSTTKKLDVLLSEDTEAQNFDDSLLEKIILDIPNLIERFNRAVGEEIISCPEMFRSNNRVFLMLYFFK